MKNFDLPKFWIPKPPSLDKLLEQFYRAPDSKEKITRLTEKIIEIYKMLSKIQNFLRKFC